MKKRITGLFAATLLALSMMAVPAMAEHQPVVSENASEQACFGQWRASYDGNQGPLGLIISEGANGKSDRLPPAEKNVQDKENCAH